MADTLTAAWITKWEQNTALVALAGKIYTSEVPERDELDAPIDPPYTMLSVGKTFYEWTFENPYYEYNQVDINIFVRGSAATGAASAEAALVEVMNTFAWQPLPYSLAKTIFVEPTDSSLDSEMVRYKGNEVIYRSSMSFRVCTQRELNL